MKFFHAGHIGDVIYSLYAIKLCGGVNELHLGPHYDQDKNAETQLAWSLNDRIATAALCKSQPYIGKVEIVDENPVVSREEYDCDFYQVQWDVHKRVDYYFENHWEWDGNHWPGNTNLRKKYVLGCFKDRMNITSILDMIDDGQGWLHVPQCDEKFDVVFHCPRHKTVRDYHEWLEIFRILSRHGCRIAIIGGDDVNDWEHSEDGHWKIIRPESMLEAAQLINECLLFMGGASSNYVIAEGVDQFRLVEFIDESIGTVPRNERGWNISTWPLKRVIHVADSILESRR